ncbi:putative secreted protein, partial [Listeria monocytogenes FSL F2-208]
MNKCTIFILFLILIIVFSGFLFWNKHQENVERETFLKEESPRIEQFLKYNY